MLRTAVLISLVGMSMALPAAHANEIQFAWNGCAGHGGALDIDLPCSDPSSAATLYLTLELSETIEDVLAVDFQVTYTAASAPIGTFWDFYSEHTFDCNGGVAVSCASPPSGCPMIAPALPGCGWGTAGLTGGGDEGRIVGSAFLPADGPVDLLAGRRYVLVGVTFDMAFAVEAGGACTGCAMPIAFGTEISGGQIPPRTKVLISSLTSGAEAGALRSAARETHIKYDGPCFSVNDGAYLCDSTTPVRTRTWGGLKLIYR